MILIVFSLLLSFPMFLERVLFFPLSFLFFFSPSFCLSYTQPSPLTMPFFSYFCVFLCDVWVSWLLLPVVFENDYSSTVYRSFTYSIYLPILFILFF
ncbi:hypothetical protein BZA70DRAFT_192963 [Myxozyma melibiosi]|uniref:Uncharacterized protein n=1 Tax=Myxozyma melibiosi TaxID=54550 RepID=A0ABR1F3N6_9ASCO